MRRLLRYAVWASTCVAVLAGAAACRFITGDEDEDNSICPQTYEFGNFGCARMVVVVEGPPTPWPSLYRFDVRAIPLRTNAGFEYGFAPSDSVGSIPLQVTRWDRGAQAPDDTVTVWVVARMLDDGYAIQTGRPIPTVAADSALHVLTFAAVGARPPVDTIRLVLRK